MSGEAPCKAHLFIWCYVMRPATDQRMRREGRSANARPSEGQHCLGPRIKHRWLSCDLGDLLLRGAGQIVYFSPYRQGMMKNGRGQRAAASTSHLARDSARLRADSLGRLLYRVFFVPVCPGHDAKPRCARAGQRHPAQGPAVPEDLSPQMAHMCLVKEAIVPEGCAGTLRTPLSPRGGLMSSELLTGFMGELSCRDKSRALSRVQAGCGGYVWSRGHPSNGDNHSLKPTPAALSQEDLGT